jgi:hypothetical protein
LALSEADWARSSEPVEASWLRSRPRSVLAASALGLLGTSASKSLGSGSSRLRFALGPVAGVVSGQSFTRLATRLGGVCGAALTSLRLRSGARLNLGGSGFALADLQFGLGGLGVRLWPGLQLGLSVRRGWGCADLPACTRSAWSPVLTGQVEFVIVRRESGEMESQSNSKNGGLDPTDDTHAEGEIESFPGTEWADTGRGFGGCAWPPSARRASRGAAPHRSRFEPGPTRRRRHWAAARRAGLLGSGTWRSKEAGIDAQGVAARGDRHSGGRRQRVAAQRPL